MIDIPLTLSDRMVTLTDSWVRARKRVVHHVRAVYRAVFRSVWVETHRLLLAQSLAVAFDLNNCTVYG